MSKIKGAIAIAAVALSLSGCGQLKALPDEQRYQFINQVKEEVDLPSVGSVVAGGYDNGDGVFSPSVFSVEIEGNDSYSKLQKRITNLSGITDCITDEIQTTCRKGQADIFLRQSKESSEKVFFSVTDKYSGRVSK